MQGPQVRAKAIKGLATTVQPGAEYQQAILERPAVVACIKRALRVSLSWLPFCTLSDCSSCAILCSAIKGLASTVRPGAEYH